MEFIVNEKGCQQLSLDMLKNMREIAQIVSAIESQNSTLKAALGDDYDSIASSVRIMTAELTNAQSELNIIIDDMSAYMEKVHQARVSLG